MAKVKSDLSHDREEELDEDKGGILYMEKNIYLFGEISPQATGSFAAAFKEADSKPGIITLHICSIGGWVEGGLCMYDLIKASRNKVIGIGCGAVYSAAVLPMQACDLRLMYKSARMLLHDMSISCGEVKYQEMGNLVGQTKEIYDLSCNYIAKRSGNKFSKIEELCNKDTFLSATKCLSLGLVDKIIKDSRNKFAEYGVSEENV